MSVSIDPDATSSHVVAVTVTYGDRRAMLLTVVDALFRQGVTRTVVVDNGARWPVANVLAELFPGFVDVVAMGGNMGSAAGYVAGLEAAIKIDAPFVWLLDDDNCPQPGCLATLRHAYEDERCRTPADRLAVLALRPEHFAGGISPRQLMTRWDSFGGFHVADIADKLLNRLLRRRMTMAKRVPLGVAPYGGMFFHRSLIEKLGLPRLEFGQYGDDTEFTWRITREGGRIIMVTDAVMDDLEEAFQQNNARRNRFIGALLADNKLRTYYTFRNLTYFESRFRRRNRLFFAVNRWLYFIILRFYAKKLGRMDCYKFIRESSDRGLNGNLEPDARFMLC